MPPSKSHPSTLQKLRPCASKPENLLLDFPTREYGRTEPDPRRCVHPREIVEGTRGSPSFLA